MKNPSRLFHYLFDIGTVRILDIRDFHQAGFLFHPGRVLIKADYPCLSHEWKVGTKSPQAT